MPDSSKARDWIAPAGIAIRIVILFIAVLPVPLTAAQELGLTPEETASWIMVLYGLTGLISLGLTIIFRQPLLTTGNLFALIFVASISHEFSYPELIGAFVLAGLCALVISALNLTGRLAAWLPAPVIFGLLAGAVISNVWRIFTALGEAPAIVGSTFVAYLLGRRFLGGWLPAILPALIAGLAVTGLTGQFGQAPDQLILPVPKYTASVFSLQAIATLTPVLIVLIILQANLPSLIFMKDQDYEPPIQVVDTISGVGAIICSIFGPTGVSLSLPITSLVAGAEAGEHKNRHRAVYLAAGGAVLIGMLAGFAAEIPVVFPSALLATLAGLALFNVLTNSLQRVTHGPLLLGPVFAFTAALSDISLFGFGPFFWALVIGTSVSLLLEREAMQTLQVEKAGS